MTLPNEIRNISQSKENGEPYPLVGVDIPKGMYPTEHGC